MELGLIGLGARGCAVAAQMLAKTSHNLLAYDPDGRVCTGTGVSTTAAEIFSRCDIIFLALERESDLISLYNGVLPFLREGQTLVDFTEISPALAHHNANAMRRQGVDCLDGGVFAREAGLTSPFALFVGGSGKAFARVQTLLRCISPDCRYMGPAGRGQAGRVLCRALAAELAGQAERTLCLADALGMREMDFASFMEIANPLGLLQGAEPVFSSEELSGDRRLAREMARRAGLPENGKI